MLEIRDYKMRGNCINCGKGFYTNANRECKAHKKYFCCRCYIEFGGDSWVKIPEHIPYEQVDAYNVERVYKREFGK